MGRWRRAEDVVGESHPCFIPTTQVSSIHSPGAKSERLPIVWMHQYVVFLGLEQTLIWFLSPLFSIFCFFLSEERQPSPSPVARKIATTRLFIYGRCFFGSDVTGGTYGLSGIVMALMSSQEFREPRRAVVRPNEPSAKSALGLVWLRSVTSPSSPSSPLSYLVR
ncbi:hypothetical protein KQX54_002422 [Cotesia glomerata]|uniref:Uncharacterized protein n=1 Tax=Cotesia glomerata TaxID=32391 RepID=A0AAV7J3J5_COTGL|nr:hypothetical protein KQX54_002422 [Cotesia glomerata]